jgi:hypothetical protein
MVLAPAACDSTSTNKATSNANAKSNLRIVLGFYAFSLLNTGVGECFGMTPEP